MHFKKNWIHQFQDSYGKIYSLDVDMLALCQRYLEIVYTNPNISHLEIFRFSSFLPTLVKGDNEMLLKPPNESEIRGSVFSINPSKAPGLMGSTLDFIMTSNFLEERQVSLWAIFSNQVIVTQKSDLEPNENQTMIVPMTD